MHRLPANPPSKTYHSLQSLIIELAAPVLAIANSALDDLVPTVPKRSHRILKQHQCWSPGIYTQDDFVAGHFDIGVITRRSGEC